MKETILKVDAAMEKEIEPRGLIDVDGKKEFAVDEVGQLMVVDTFGTADEDRFWDRAAFERGRQVEFSKEFVRQHYRPPGTTTPSPPRATGRPRNWRFRPCRPS